MFMKIEGANYEINNHLAWISEDLILDLIIKSVIQNNNALHLKKFKLIICIVSVIIFAPSSKK